MNARKRKAVAKSTVAKYWAFNTSPDRLVRFVDYGEPACMACGKFDPDWDKPKTPVAKWNNAQLEICHVIAKQFGGTEDCSNLILLCKKCHRDSPDVNDDGTAMREWLTDPSPKGSLGELARMVSSRPDFEDIAAIFSTLDPSEVAEEAIRRAGLHGGMISPATWLHAWNSAVFYLHEKRSGVAA